jgi:sn-glycerol 3-phosphate transport system permease protein
MALAMKRRRRAGFVAALVLLSPSLIFLTTFTYWPVLWVFNESFRVGRFAGQSGFGFGNYSRLFADPHFSRAAWNNFVYAAGTTAPSLVLALALALALRETNRFNALLRTLWSCHC